MYVYTEMYIYIHICTYIYIYVLALFLSFWFFVFWIVFAIVFCWIDASAAERFVEGYRVGACGVVGIFLLGLRV